MKRLMLAALLSVAAAAIAPVASASAAEAVECTFKGKAHFLTSPLGPVPTVGLDEFTFATDGTAVNKCNTKTASVTLAGKAHLSCTVSPGLGVEGLGKAKGTLTVEGKEAFTLSNFEFAGGGPTVTFATVGHNKTEEFVGTGAAKFVETLESLEQCKASALGEVEFQATAAGIVTP
jgi:hypothetical protein